MTIPKKTIGEMFLDALAGITVNFAGNFNPAVKKVGEILCWDKLQANLPDVSDLIAMRTRGALSEDDYQRFMGYCGFKKEWLNLFDAIQRQYLSPYEYTMLLHRGDITPKYYETVMRSMKCWDNVSDFKSISMYFPTVPDLVRFAVREVYTPDTVKKFGQLEDIPPNFISEAKKAGLPEEQAKNYWSSHWQLPSMSEVFEMFHRTTTKKLDNDADEIQMPSGATCHNVIGTKTVDMAIKALDVMPYWRDKMREISYNPLTRVDVRRMYQSGAIDQDKVFRSYLDEGYSPENATALTQFVVKEYSQEMHGITRATLDKAFKEDVITKEDYIDHLKAMNISSDVIDFYVSLAEYDKHIIELKQLIATLTSQYEAGEITIDQVRVEITKMEVPTQLIESTVSKILKHNQKKQRLPDKADVMRWYAHDIINREQFRAKMLMLGYILEDINNYDLEVTQKRSGDNVAAQNTGGE
jgi:hypothetical protein